MNESDIILDIGCGGGTNVKRMASKSAKVYGVDYSPKAVERAKELNKDIKNVEIIESSVSNLPFEDNTFDVITAIKTVFFWPDLVNDFKEVKRVLKPDGIFAIIVDYNGANGKKMMEFAERLLEMDPKNDIETTYILLDAGFREVTSYIRNTKVKREIKKVNNIIEKESADTFSIRADFSDKMEEWICLIAKK
ncbi:class I SAM-dependent methyltransferase [Methanobrevibacter sp.]|uniref:class I SAM-dependent methyltransferase n=1 Tax=Methanobrevibacter sp. TaxID=66852 RepID=UPI003866BB28